MGEKFQRLYSGALLCSTHLKITVICCQCNTATTSAVVSLMARKVDKEDGAVFKFTLSHYRRELRHAKESDVIKK